MRLAALEVVLPSRTAHHVAAEPDMPATIDPPVATAQMLIRKPVAEVFEAVVDPAITSRFWFSKGSGTLETGKPVRWDWEMYGVGTDVDVKAIEDNRRILYQWNGPGNPSWVEWTFEPLAADRTLVTVKNWGFGGRENDAVRGAIGSAGGFSFVLAGMKAFLEHGIELNLIADHDPKALVETVASRQ
jgi:uncharacterized protein YndB with AHSA1/START domain